MRKFKVGDRVRLKSGGPCMTVISVDDDNYYSVTWFDGNNRLTDELHEDTLTSCDEPLGVYVG